MLEIWSPACKIQKPGISTFLSGCEASEIAGVKTIHIGQHLASPLICAIKLLSVMINLLTSSMRHPESRISLLENSHRHAIAPDGAMVWKRWGSLCEQARSLPHHFHTTPTGLKPAYDENRYSVKLSFGHKII